MKLSQTQHEESTFRKWWNSRSFIQRRMIRLCLSILVMLICFPLYYLGFFGGVEGPLNPSEIGDALARMGVTKTHSMIFFPTLLIVSVSWNWIYNLVSLVMGARLTCNKADDRGHPCGASVKRSKAIRKKTGKSVTQYVCLKGHKRPDAHFHPVRKGTVSHTLWVIALAFCVVVFFLS
jgi:hypothetical protein